MSHATLQSAIDIKSYYN